MFKIQKVAGVCKNITHEPIIADENEDILSIHKKILAQKEPAIRCVYVLNAEKKVVGMISLKEIMRIIAIRKALPLQKRFSVKNLFTYISKDTKARMIMRPPVTIREDENIADALKLMIEHDSEEAAVINQNGVIVGDLNVYEILKEITL